MLDFFLNCVRDYKNCVRDSKNLFFECVNFMSEDNKDDNIKNEDKVIQKLIINQKLMKIIQLKR